jgi:hypothetical protein
MSPQNVRVLRESVEYDNDILGPHLLVWAAQPISLANERTAHYAGQQYQSNVGQFRTHVSPRTPILPEVAVPNFYRIVVPVPSYLPHEHLIHSRCEA